MPGQNRGGDDGGDDDDDGNDRCVHAHNCANDVRVS